MQGVVPQAQGLPRDWKSCRTPEARAAKKGTGAGRQASSTEELVDARAKPLRRDSAQHVEAPVQFVAAGVSHISAGGDLADRAKAPIELHAGVDAEPRQRHLQRGARLADTRAASAVPEHHILGQLETRNAYRGPAGSSRNPQR